MNKTAKNSIIYLFGTIVLGVLGFVNTMLLTRMVSTQVYAMYGLFATFVSAMVTFISFGYDAAYMRFYYCSGSPKIHFLWKCLQMPLAIACICGILLLEPSQTLVRFIFETHLSGVVLALLAGYIAVSVLHRFTMVSARMEEQAGNYVFSNIVGKSGFIAIAAAAYFAMGEITFDWIIISSLLAGVVAVLVNAAVFRIQTAVAEKESTQVSRKELFVYGFPYMLNNFLLLVIPLLEKMVIRELAGWELLGLFGAASVFQTVVLMIVNTVDNIWNPIVYKYYDQPALFKPIMHNFGLFAVLLTGVGVATCILLRRWLVLLLDERYYAVFVIAPTIMLGAFLNIITIIYGVGINIEKKTVNHVICPLIQFLLSVVLYFMLLPEAGLIGIGISTLVSLAVSRIYKIWMGLQYYDTGRSEVKSMILCCVYTIAAMLSLFWTSLTADIIMCTALLVLILTISASEVRPLLHDTLMYIKPEKKL